METWVWLLIGAFLAADAIVTFVVLRNSRRRKRQEAAGSADDLSRQIGLE